MPSARSSFRPVHDSVISNASDLMPAFERQAVLDAGVHVLWVRNTLKKAETALADARVEHASRIRRTRIGEGRYILHATFLAPGSVPPLENCGLPGDIWTSEPNIYFKSDNGWTACRTEYEAAPRHPFLVRQLALHPEHCAMVWIPAGSVRQHWSNGKWSQQTIASIDCPGIANAVASDDIIALFQEDYRTITAAHISRYLARILRLFVPSNLSGPAHALADGNPDSAPAQTTAAHKGSSPDDSGALPLPVGADASSSRAHAMSSDVHHPLESAEDNVQHPCGGGGQQYMPDNEPGPSTGVQRDRQPSVEADEHPLDIDSGFTMNQMFQSTTSQHVSVPKSPGLASAQQDGNEENPDELNSPAEMVTPAAQPYYAVFPRKKYASDDANLHNFTFFNGAVVAAAPNLRIPGLDEDIRDADRKILQWMSKGQDATAPSQRNGQTIPPLVEVLVWPSKSSFKEKMLVCQKLQDIICANRVALVVVDSQDSAFEWTEEEIGFLTSGIPGNCSLFGSWQSTRMRDMQHQRHRRPGRNYTTVNIYDHGSVKNFMDSVKKGEDPVNWLDGPKAAGYAPDMICYLSDDSTCWDLTSRLGFARPRKVPDDCNSSAKPQPTPSQEEEAKALKDSGNRSDNLRIKAPFNTGIDDPSDLTDQESDKEPSMSKKKTPTSGRQFKSTASDAKRKGKQRADVASHGKRKLTASASDRHNEQTRPSKKVKRNTVSTGSSHQFDNNSSTSGDPSVSAQPPVDSNSTSNTSPEGAVGPVPIQHREGHKFEFKTTGVIGKGCLTQEMQVNFKRRWIILTGRFFLTWGHHDTAGLITWIEMLTGLKIWSYLIPKDLSDNPEIASAQYIKFINSLDHFSLFTEDILPDIADPHNVFLFPGSVLIQPPGMVHQVVTAEESATRGGYLYMWNAMHLTEWTRLLSHLCHRVGTNDLHEGALRALSRMMIAIATRKERKALKKPFMALARLVIHFEEYWRGDYDREDAPQAVKELAKNAPLFLKESRNELDEAGRIARAILTYNGLSDAKLDVKYEIIPSSSPEEEPEQGAALSWKIPECIKEAWYEVGEDYIDIPDFEIFK